MWTRLLGAVVTFALAAVIASRYVRPAQDTGGASPPATLPPHPLAAPEPILVPDPTPDPPPAPRPIPAPTPAVDATPLRVLYVEGVPRWEFAYLGNVLTRDPTLRAWVSETDPDGDAQPRTSAGLDPIDVGAAFSSAASLAAFDVVLVGDLDASRLVPGPDGATRALTSLREFVAQGGGLALIAGARNMPSKLAGTALEDVIPIQLDRGAASPVSPAGRGWRGFQFGVTSDGERCPFLDVAGNPATSKRLWETTDEWRQYWVYPSGPVRSGAVVQLEVSAMTAGGRQAQPAVVTSKFGRGRVVFVGVDELWRMRYDVGDRYFGKFWVDTVRWLGAAER